MSRQPKSSNRRRNCPVSAQSSSGSARQSVSRSKVAYWRDRLEKVASKTGKQSPDYSVRVVFKNRRVRFPLHTSNKEAAAAKAAKIYGHLIENGWADTIETFKPTRKQTSPTPESESRNTVGDLIAVNQKYSSAQPQTLHAYVKALRRIVSGVMEIEDGKKYQSRGGDGAKTWQQSVDAVSLHDLTPERIQRWKTEFLAEAGQASRRQATTTINSLIRNAKALFSKKLRGFLDQELDMPSPLPFEGVSMEKPPSQRYRSRIDAKALLTLAGDELRGTEDEPYKILLLAAVCGLRISEIDWLPWSAFDFQEGILEVADTVHHQLKSQDSAGEIPLSSDLTEIFRAYADEAGSEFVINSGGAVERSRSARSYRCQRHIDVLKNWLRVNGIKAAKPIHELRKEVGSVIASEEGIFAASRYLRHSDIRITSSIYADQKKRVVPSFGRTLID